ncbi:MAG TPA: thioredoxin [Nannocystaceae bacterium]|nr:thioredoxin [Nannocystaceae bacterium]
MASPKITHTSDKDFANDVLNSATPVLVDFWAVWCGPCKAIAPHLDALADDLDGRLKIVKLDVDHNPNVAGTHRVQSIPTLLLFKGGQVVDKMVGNPGSKKKIADFVERHL